MKDIQASLLNYVRSSKFFSLLFKIDVLLAILYPMYLILAKITWLSVVWDYVSAVSTLLFISYYVGTILCFAGNKQIPLDIVFGCMAINSILNLQYGITFDRLVYIVFYSIIVGVCIVKTKESRQWNRLKETTLRKAAEYADAANGALSNRPSASNFCPQCGAKLDQKMRFCNQCGNPLNRR